MNFKQYYTEAKMGMITFPSSLVSKVNKFVSDYVDALYSKEIKPLKYSSISKDFTPKYDSVKEIKDKRHLVLKIKPSDFNSLSKLFSRSDTKEILLQFKSTKRNSRQSESVLESDSKHTKFIITTFLDEQYITKTEGFEKMIKLDIQKMILHELTHYIQYTALKNVKLGQEDKGDDESDEKYYSNVSEIGPFYQNLISYFTYYVDKMLPDKKLDLEINSKEGFIYLTKLMNDFLKKDSTLRFIKKAGKIEEYNKGIKILDKQINKYIKDNKILTFRDFILSD